MIKHLEVWSRAVGTCKEGCAPGVWERSDAGLECSRRNVGGIEAVNSCLLTPSPELDRAPDLATLVVVVVVVVAGRRARYGPSHFNKRRHGRGDQMLPTSKNPVEPQLALGA